jgi:hypothetical protein
MRIRKLFAGVIALTLATSAIASQYTYRTYIQGLTAAPSAPLSGPPVYATFTGGFGCWTVQADGLTATTNGTVSGSCPSPFIMQVTKTVVTSGKWYGEITMNSAGEFAGASVTGGYIAGCGYWSAGDVVGIALDMDAKTVSIYQNCQTTARCSPAVTGSSSGMGVETTTAYGAMSVKANFGQSAFHCAVPAGFHAGLYTQ